MKVLRVINTMNPKYGGPCQGIRNSIPEMQKNGVINEVVCMDDASEEFLKLDGFKIHAIGKAKGPWSYHPGLVPWLVANLKYYDAVIIHGLWLYHGHATRKALKLHKRANPDSKLKYYVMPHGMLDPYFQNATGRKLKAIRNLIYWALIERKVVNEADALLFTCQEELNLARLPFTPYHPKEEINVGYGIQTPPKYKETMLSAFKNAAQNWAGNDYILYLSRIHQKKGTDLLIKAFIRLKSEFPKVPNLIVAGPGLDTDYGKKIVSMAYGHHEIIFPGMLSGDSKWGGFYGCMAYVLPSHQENFGIAVVEALACAKPVVITNEVNIWREIQDGNAGIVVSDDETGIYLALKELLSKTAAEFSIMEENALNLFAEKFNITTAAQTLKNTLEARLK